MFRHLTDFSYRRTIRDAVGFYLAYFGLIVIGGFLVGALAGVVMGGGDSVYEIAVRIGTLFAIIVCVVLSFTILQKKRLMGNLGYVAVAVSSGILAIFGGALLGLVPAAFLSTR